MRFPTAPTTVPASPLAARASPSFSYPQGGSRPRLEHGCGAGCLGGSPAPPLASPAWAAVQPSQASPHSSVKWGQIVTPRTVRIKLMNTHDVVRT